MRNNLPVVQVPMKGETIGPDQKMVGYPKLWQSRKNKISRVNIKGENSVAPWTTYPAKTNIPLTKKRWNSNLQSFLFHSLSLSIEWSSNNHFLPTEKKIPQQFELPNIWACFFLGHLKLKLPRIELAPNIWAWSQETN